MDYIKPKFYTRYNSPLGELFLFADENFLFEIAFARPTKEKLFDLVEQSEKDSDIFRLTKHWLDQYFAGENPSPKEIPIKFLGTDFQRQVWSDLEQIDYGQTLTYGELAQTVAKQLNKKAMANQAIGQAVGRNPIPILVPCHRVVGIDGNLTGYSGGLDKKIKLLQIEGIDLTKFYLEEKQLNLVQEPEIRNQLIKKINKKPRFEQINLELE